jgi:predicted transcriptional regulator
VPVVQDDGKVVGLVTERELFTKDRSIYLPMYITMLSDSKFTMTGNEKLPYVAGQITRACAKDIMNREIYFASPDMDIHQLVSMFAFKGVNPIPVTDAQNHLMGIVSRSDILSLLSESHVKSDAPLSSRPVDDEAGFVHSDISSRFAFVARIRANIWITTAVVLFILGFVIGVLVVVNPSIIKTKAAEIPRSIRN